MLRCVRTQSVEISGVAVVLWRSKHRIRGNAHALRFRAPFLQKEKKKIFFSSLLLSSKSLLELFAISSVTLLCEVARICDVVSSIGQSPDPVLFARPVQ